MLTACLVCAFIMAFWGGILNEENASSLLSGYNTMSDEKKKNVDFKGITKIYKKVLYGVALGCALVGISGYFFTKNENLSVALLILVICWGMTPLFFLGKKYDPNSYPKWQKILNYFILALLIFGGLFAAVMVYMSEGNLIE